MQTGRGHSIPIRMHDAEKRVREARLASAFRPEHCADYLDRAGTAFNPLRLAKAQAPIANRPFP